VVAPGEAAAQQAHLLKLHAADEHTTAELAELFQVSRPTVDRTQAGRHRIADRTGAAGALLPPTMRGCVPTASPMGRKGSGRHDGDGRVYRLGPA